jgi:hypothetical protein
MHQYVHHLRTRVSNRHSDTLTRGRSVTRLNCSARVVVWRTRSSECAVDGGCDGTCHCTSGTGLNECRCLLPKPSSHVCQMTEPLAGSLLDMIPVEFPAIPSIDSIIADRWACLKYGPLPHSPHSPRCRHVWSFLSRAPVLCCPLLVVLWPCGRVLSRSGGSCVWSGARNAVSSPLL